MPQLIRVGNTVINLAHIESAEIADGTVSIRFSGGSKREITFDGVDAEALARVLNDSRFVYSTYAVEGGVRGV